MQIINESGYIQTYITERKAKIAKIKDLLKLGYKPKWYSKNNWFELGNYSFNGFTREQVEVIINDSK